MDVIFFNSKVQNFLLSLEKQSVAQSSKRIQLLKAFGPKLGMPYSKKISLNLFELRIRGRQEVRIFYCFHHNQVVIVHIFVKKSQKTPIREIKTAMNRVSSLT